MSGHECVGCVGTCQVGPSHVCPYVKVMYMYKMFCLVGVCYVDLGHVGLGYVSIRCVGLGHDHVLVVWKQKQVEMALILE